ncbi:hypothetical protein OROMI_002619 [Orobanche minor]
MFVGPQLRPIGGSIMAHATTTRSLLIGSIFSDAVWSLEMATNDAPALHEADIGLSMGIQGTEVAKESSYIIILDNSFASVVKVVLWGRSVYANIQKLIQFELTVNVAALVINVVAAISLGDVSLITVQVCIDAHIYEEFCHYLVAIRFFVLGDKNATLRSLKFGTAILAWKFVQEIHKFDYRSFA